MSKGRPQNPNSIKKTGKLLIVWVTKEEAEKVESMSRELEVSMAEVIRQLIKKAE